MAKLYFRYGAMGSSKTANALMVAFNYEERDQKVLFLKASADIRDGVYTIRSRIGLSRDCLTMKEFAKMNRQVVSLYDCLIVDEAQFLSTQEVDMLAAIADDLNIPVLCYGLRTDFQGHFFEGSKRLMEIADSIEEIKTVCWCGKKAIFNARYNASGIVKEGNQLELGGNDKYVALCRKHYKEGSITSEKHLGGGLI